MHLYRTLLLHRDYFTPGRCISIWLFCAAGIISPGWMHLYRTLLLHRDYFTPGRCISIWLFCAAGIISTDRMHPITGRPSLKTSLPGHSVNFRFNQSSVTSSLPSPHACPSRIRPLLLSSLQLGTNVHISRVGNCLHLHVVLSRHLDEKLLTQLPQLLVRIFSVPDL